LISVTDAAKYLADRDVDPLTATLVVPDKQVGAVLVVGTVTTRLNRLVRAVEKAERDRKTRERSEAARQRVETTRARTAAATARQSSSRPASSLFGSRVPAAPSTRGGGGGESGFLGGLEGGAFGTAAMAFLKRYVPPIAIAGAAAGGVHSTLGRIADPKKQKAWNDVGAGWGPDSVAINAYHGVKGWFDRGGPSSVASGVATAYRDASDFVESKASDAAQIARDSWSTATTKLDESAKASQQVLSEAWESVKVTAGKYREEVDEWLRNQGTTLREWFDSIVSGLRSSISLQAIRTMAYDWLDRLRQWFGNKFGMGGGKGSSGGGNVPTPAPDLSALNPAKRGQTFDTHELLYGPKETQLGSAPATGSTGFGAGGVASGSQFFKPSMGSGVDALSNQQLQFAGKYKSQGGGIGPTPVAGSPATPSLLSMGGKYQAPAGKQVDALGASGGAIVGAVNDAERGYKNTGSIVLRDPETGKVLGQYRYVTGGGGHGSAPEAEYKIGSMMQGGSLGDRWVLTQKGQPTDTAQDPGIPGVSGPRTRTELRIHEAHGQGTLGCVGILGGHEVYQDFERNLLHVLSKNGGSATLRLGSPEAHRVMQNMTPVPRGASQQTLDRIKNQEGQPEGASAVPLSSPAGPKGVAPSSTDSEQPPAPAPKSNPFLPGSSSWSPASGASAWSAAPQPSSSATATPAPTSTSAPAASVQHEDEAKPTTLEESGQVQYQPDSSSEDSPAPGPASSAPRGKRVDIDDIPTVHPDVHLAVVAASDMA